MDGRAPLIDDDRVLAALLESPSTVLIGARLDGTIDRWSRGATLLYGWSEDEALGQSLEILVPPERRHELQMSRSLASGDQIPPFETARRAKDGAVIPVELHLVVLRDDAGTAVGTLGLHRDIRDARRLQRALQEREQEWRVRFDESPVPQSRVTLDGRILAVNAALQELLGRDADDLVGGDAVALYAEESRPAVLEALTRLVTGEVTSMAQEHDLLRPDGSRRRTITSVSVVHDDGAGPVLAAAIEDVTALRAAQEQVRVEASRYDALLASMPVAVFTYDGDGICTSSRGQVLRKLGFQDNQLVGVDLLGMYEEQPHLQEALRAPLEGREGRTIGSENGIELRGHYHPLRGEDGEIVGGIGIAIDITELTEAEREVRASEARLRSLLQHASDSALVLDGDGRISYASPAVTGQLGYDHEKLVGRSGWEFDHPDDHPTVLAALREIVDRPGAVTRFECRVRDANGTWRWTEQVVTNLRHDPAVRGTVVNLRDTTDRRRADEELRRLAVRDSLTGLANRTLLLDRVEQALAAGRRTGAITGLVVLDVVGMGEHNEQRGQAAGDEVLRVLAERLEGSVRAGDSVARVGGDEFAVLVEDVASAEDLRALAASLLEVADEAVPVDGAGVLVRLQAGSAVSPAADAGALLAAAEQAIPHDSWSRRVVVRTVEAAAGAERSAAEDRLRRAIGGGELVLHYQPVVELRAQEPVGVEALVRWQHPERGLLAPSEFIPLAEQSGLVVALGEWVLRAAVSQVAAWRADGRRLSVGVNLSPRQLVGSAFPVLVTELLEEFGLEPEGLVLEVTESALMDDPGAPEVLRALREMGVRLALDDFGTGYSSLTYLKRFPVDSIKVDRSFVSGLGRDADDEAIVTSVVSLARGVGKLVVAEGVETVGQLDALRTLGVDRAQGFLWSRPVPAADLVRWLDAHRATALPVRAAAAGVQPPAAPAVVDSDHQRILALHGEGASLHTIAAALNAEGRRTPAGPRWTTTTVARVIAGRLSPR